MVSVFHYHLNNFPVYQHMLRTCVADIFSMIIFPRRNTVFIKAELIFQNCNAKGKHAQPAYILQHFNRSLRRAVDESTSNSHIAASPKHQPRETHDEDSVDLINIQHIDHNYGKWSGSYIAFSHSLSLEHSKHFIHLLLFIKHSNSNEHIRSNFMRSVSCPRILWLEKPRIEPPISR